MFASLRHLIGGVINAFRSRQDLMLENLALRQQLLALHAKRPRHRLSTPQKWFLGDLAAAQGFRGESLFLVLARESHSQ